jgi:hypothetical protein
MTDQRRTEQATVSRGESDETPVTPGPIDPLTIATSASLAALVALLVSGLVLAMVGLHHALLQAPLALVIGGALFRVMPRHRTTERPRGVAVVVLLLAMGVVLLNAGLRSELVLTGRDGATYATTAGFLVEGSGLFPAAVEEPFIGTDLDFDAPGFVPRSDGTFWQQFLHSTPALYGFAGEVFGKQALFSVNAVVAGIGVLAMFCLASLMMTAWWAVLATSLAAISLPYVYYARGTFSEMAALALTMGGLWVAHLAFTTSPRFALPAGLLLGGTVLVRVDSWMMGISLGLLVATAIWLGEQHEAGIAKQLYLGFAVGGTLSLIDLVAFGEPYLANLGKLIVIVIVAAVAARLLAPVAGAGPIRRFLPPYLRRLNRAKLATTAGLIAAAAYLWVVRPLITQGAGQSYDLGAIQAREGLAIDPTRSYSELSVHWIVWYVGIPIVLLGIVGMVVAARRSLAPGTAASRMIFLAFFVPAATYLVRPSINPDQIWAIRRFLPVVIPLLVMFAIATIDALVGRIPNGRLVRPTAVALGLLAAVPLLVTSRPLIFHSEHAGMGAQMVSLCASLGDSKSVLILDDDPELPLSWLIGPPLRSWCQVSVAATPAGVDYDVAPDAVIASEPQLLPTDPEGSHEFTAEAWERSLSGAPAEVATGRLKFWIDKG